MFGLCSVAYGRIWGVNITVKSRIVLSWKLPMTDMYVYRFIAADGSSGTDNGLYMQAATLEAIKGKGEPVMESQIVVDDSEVDGDGFLLRFGISTNEIDDLWSQIRSLKLRAESRDKEALTLDERAEGQRKYMLELESRELRAQAQKLTTRRVDLLTERFHRRGDSRDVAPFEGILAAE